ncbi:MAG: alpha/beta fold hydrolase, partial [Paracoccaceae bacterium]
GLSDRLIDDALLGHVEKFSDYQLDVAAMSAAADDLGCPRRRFLLAHSLGGCIVLRALHEGLPVKAATFSAPMWGMLVAPSIRPLAGPVIRAMNKLGKGTTRAPGTDADTYVKIAPFQDNTLTTDPDMFSYMQRQAAAHSEIVLARPPVNWVQQAFAETATLQNMSPPNYPVPTVIGQNERIVNSAVTLSLMAKWKRSQLKTIPDAEHELMMELPKIRSAFFTEMDAQFFNNSR